MTLTIELPDEKGEQLNALARQSSLTLEELIAASAVALVAERPQTRSERIEAEMQRILEKNAELYRRLA